VETTKPAKPVGKDTFLDTFLGPLGLLEYKKLFIQEGYDQKNSIVKITEDDLKEMKVKRGHQRLILDALRSLRGQSGTASRQNFGQK